MTVEYLYMALGRMIEERLIDKRAEVFASNLDGNLSPIIAIDPVNRKLDHAVVLPSVSLAFARLT